MSTVSRGCALLVVAVLGVAGLASAPAAEGNEGQEPDGARAMSGERPAAADFAAVERQAEARGVARVIVGLRVDFVPEGHLRAQDAGRQRSDIAAARRRLLDSVDRPGVEVARSFDTVPFVALTVAEDAVAALRASRHVASVDLDEVVWPTLRHSTPLQQGDVLHDDGTTGAGQTVAILDTGVDVDHPAFAGRVVEEACYSTNEASLAVVSLCPDGSGTQLGDGAAAPCDVSEMGDCFHGTHVAGIAAGDHALHRGMAPAADVMAIQVFSRFDDDAACPGVAPCIGAANSDIIAGLERVLEVSGDRAIAAANLSLGGGRHTGSCDDEPIKTVIDNLVSVDTATTVATGNQGWSDAVSWPACVSSSVAVSSTTKTDEVSGFANTHPSMVDLYAIGSAITAPLTGGGFTTSGGTSMAAPQVAGGWALLAEREPTVSVPARLTELQSSGTDIAEHEGGTTLPYTHPRINLAPAAELDYQRANMTFDDAAEIDGLTYTDQQRTWNAVLEDDEPLAACASGDGMAPTVWYRYNPDVGGTIVANTGGSTFDTTLAVYTGAELDALTPSECDAGTQAANYTDAAVELAVTAGTDYWLQVGGWSPLDRGQARLNVTDASLATISGMVTDGDTGAGLEGAQVEVVGPDVESTTATADGGYAVAGLEPGQYTVTASADGYADATDTVDVVAGQTATVPLALAALPGELEGVVTAAGSGVPIEGAQVSLEGPESASTTTAADGGYAVADLERGVYELTVTADGYAEVTEVVEVEPGGPTVADVALTELPGAVAGTVTDTDTDEPLEGAQVDVEGPDNASASTGADGAYELTDLEAGEYTITVTADGYAETTETVDVEPGETAVGDVALAALPGTVAGTVTDADTGAALEGVQVSFEGPESASTTTAADGGYTAADLARGEYTVTVAADGYEPAEREVVVEPGGSVTAHFALAADVAPGVARMAGPDRFATAAALSRASFEPGAPVVYIATGTGFADALTGGVAAARAEAPVLLATRDTIPAATVDELARLDADRIVILGGTGVISTSVAAELAGFTDGPVERLAGANRFATAAEIAQETFSGGAGTVYVSTGLNFPDALAGVPAAAAAPGPLLLVASDSVPSATADELARLDADRIVVLGGTGVIDSGVAADLDAYGTVERIAGAGRFATAGALAANAFADPAAVHTVYVATGLAFPDALAAGAVAGAEPSPVLLVATDSVPAETAAELDRLDPRRIVVMGGTGAVSAAVEVELDDYLAD